jgi:hypothetical protein
VVARTRERDQDSTILRMRNFCDQQRCGSENNSVSETQDQSGSNEHADVLRSSLNCNSYQHDNASNRHTDLPALPVNEIRGKEETDERAEGHG